MSLVTPLATSTENKEEIINDNFSAAYAVTTFGVIDRNLTAPPASPSSDGVYIPKAPATGVWAGQEDNLAFYSVSGWKFLPPSDGMKISSLQDNNFIKYTLGSGWGVISSSGVVSNFYSVTNFGDLPTTGVNENSTGLTTSDGKFYKHNGLNWVEIPTGSTTVTTKGDLITHNGTAEIRVPVPTVAGKVVKSNPSHPNGWEWGDDEQGSGGSGGSSSPSGVRETLTADTTFYISPTGLAGNDGLTAGSPQDLQTGLDRIAALDPRSFTPTLKLAAGTYDLQSSIILPDHLAPVEAIIEGEPDRTQVILDITVAANAPTVKYQGTRSWRLKDLTIANNSVNPSASSYCLNHTGAQITLDNVRVLGSGGNRGIQLDRASRVFVRNTLEISGSFGSFLFVVSTSCIFNLSGQTLELTNGASAGTFIFALTGNFNIRFTTINGTFTGNSYNAVLNSTFRTDSGTSSDVPGSGGSGTSGTQFDD